MDKQQLVDTLHQCWMSYEQTMGRSVTDADIFGLRELVERRIRPVIGNELFSVKVSRAMPDGDCLHIYVKLLDADGSCDPIRGRLGMLCRRPNTGDIAIFTEDGGYRYLHRGESLTEPTKRRVHHGEGIERSQAEGVNEARP